MTIPAASPDVNILFITVDQWRADLFDQARKAGLALPHLERLAAQGTSFAQHYCQAYPCGPSRASLVTGLYAHKHRSILNGTPLDARHPTLFTELRRAGYRPRLFGYTDTTLDPRGKSPQDPDLGDYENVTPGLVVDTLLTESATPWLADLKAKGYDIPDPDLGREGVFAQRHFTQPTIFAAQDSESAFLADRFLSWASVAGKAPWCAHLSFIAPHPPFAAPAPYCDKVAAHATQSPLRGADLSVEQAQHPLMQALLGEISAEGFAPGLSGLAKDVDAKTIAQVRAIYLGQASLVDDCLGRIFAALEEMGLDARTVIVFTADHGEQLFDHWMLGKAGYFDQSAHVPLIIRHPHPDFDAGRGRVVPQFTQAVDLMPTLLDMAALSAPRNCDGLSLLPFCKGETPTDWRDAVYWSTDFRDSAAAFAAQGITLPSDWCNLQVVRTERLKYVHFAALPPVLFDLQNDPQELVNRAQDPDYTALRLEGMDRLLSWRQRHEDRTLSGLRAVRGRLQNEDDPA